MRNVLGAALCLAVLALLLILPKLWAGRRPQEPQPSPLPSAEPSPTPAAAAEGGFAVWVSYLEWQQVDFSSAQAFLADISVMLDNIQAAGGTAVLAQVRPFGDALYPSALFPFSHLCTGVQGQDPGFDPLALLVQAAHDRGLALEAWVNPYRLSANGVPAALCGSSPAKTHPDWVRESGGWLVLDPSSPQVRQYIADGVDELCRNYAVDGIHFDDYFYPTTDPAFDAEEYAASGTTLALADWRRDNVNALIRLCWQTVHQYEGVRFGVSPQGSLELCRAAQYSDAALWLAEPGYVDYLMPQLYWGLDSLLPERADVWLNLPRARGVALYFGLGAYRVGEGEQANLTEWRSGHALADQRDWLLERGADGVALYRYASLWDNGSYPELAAAELAALA